MAENTIITAAPEVHTMADGLIRSYHPELLECTIAYFFTSAEALCTPRKCNPLLRYLASLHLEGAPRAAVEEGPDLLMLVNVEEWDYLVPGQHEPFVDHRLAHIGREEKSDAGIRWVINPHGVEEFHEVVRRFGLWKHDLKTLGRIIQPELDLGLPAERDETALRQSSIDRVTLSTPSSEPVSMSYDAFQRIVHQHTRD